MKLLGAARKAARKAAKESRPAAALRRIRFEEGYRRLREQYHRRDGEPVLIGDYGLGAPRALRRPIRTFAVIPSVSWHDALLPELGEIGAFARFDYRELFAHQTRHGYDRAFFALRREMNRRLLAALEREAENGIDWIFCYAQGNHLLADTVREMRARFRVPVVNMCLDDKNSWSAGMLEGQDGGSLGLVSAFDLWWTTSPESAKWVVAEGGRPFCMPEGCSPALYDEAPEASPTIPVSFVGTKYGARAEMIDYLRRHRVPVSVFGKGWGPGSELPTSKDVARVFRSSQINLGHGGMGASGALTNVKGRDFDIACAGGGAYLTTFNPELARSFHVSEEILCWRTPDELLEQARYLLHDPRLCREMARKARARCLREHRWSQRFERILLELGLLQGLPNAEGVST